ncbi:MAG: DNA topoisomerase (ATP-hydrolyzing) subunit A [Spirochaetes bacterium]|nr:DNA topoisomerase (ATP-hydrolyzing) subunit A [Spirochaetota bacterium]
MGNIYPIDIEEELKNSYMTYAMSVIVSRAIPDVRDGLKPVHRRILYSMNEMGLKANSQYKKCGRIVGDVLGKYHPHGDQAIYSTLVRMAQGFSMRYIAVDGHGNFGSVDGDPPAAMRYTEARLSKAAELMLKDIDKETVDFGPNYDDSMTEPLVLPSAIPYQLINGASGIAVGMATNIAPHNLGEVVGAITAQIDNPDIEIKDLMKFIKGPDFPTAGIIYGTNGIKRAYKTGRGHIIVRAKLKLEENKTGKDVIIITELPYQVNKKELIEKIAELVKLEKIMGISHIRDESDRSGLRIVIELKKDVIPKVVINQLYSHTNLQISFSVHNLFLMNGKPQTLTLKETIQAYIDFRKEVVYKRTKFELKKAEERAHIVEGLLIALNNIDAVIDLIKKSKDVKEAKEGLIIKFNMTDVQAQAVLDMRLQRLTNLEVNKLKDEFTELKNLIKRLKEILSSDKNVLQVVRGELIENTKSFIDERRTEIVPGEIEDFEIEDLIQKEDMVITISSKGFIKRTAFNVYRSQGKGGVGASSGAVREDDFIEHLFIASTHDYLIFFSNKGLVYRLKVHQIPQLAKTSRGQTIKTLINIHENEQINAIINVKNFDDPNKFFFIATRNGIVKKTPVSEFKLIQQKGKKAITLDEDNEVIDVKITDGNNDLIMTTRNGKALRIVETKVRPMGRAARGVTGIRLQDDDKLCSVCLVNEDYLMLLVTENGYGKRLEFDNFSCHGRGTSGQRYYKYNEQKGHVVAVKQVAKGDDVIVITSRGIAIKISTEQISKQGRNASGIRLVKVVKPDFVTAVSTTPKK